MRDITFTVLFMMMALMALRYAHLSMMLWVWSALFPPNEYLYGFAQDIPFNKISVVCAVVALVVDKRKSLSIDVLLAWLIVFFGEVSLSYVMAATPADWGSVLYDRLWKVIAAALFIRFTVVDRLRLHSVILAICLAVGSGAVDEGLKFILSAGGHHVAGPHSWGDENITATIILMVIPLILYLYRYAINKKFKVGLMATCVICVMSVVGTYSRGGFAGLIIFGALSLAASRRRIVPVMVLLVVAGMGVAFIPESWFARIHTTTNVTQDYSFMERVIQWKILTLVALDHPFLGGGILVNMVPQIWQLYASRLGSELTFIPTPPPTVPFASHSIYFQILGETGFVGLFLFLIVFGLAFRVVSDIRKRARRESSLTWAADMAVAIRTSLLLFLVTGAALPIPYLEFPYLLLGCLSALRNIQVNEMRKILRMKKHAENLSKIALSNASPEVNAP